MKNEMFKQKNRKSSPQVRNQRILPRIIKSGTLMHLWFPLICLLVYLGCAVLLGFQKNWLCRQISYTLVKGKSNLLWCKGAKVESERVITTLKYSSTVVSHVLIWFWKLWYLNKGGNLKFLWSKSFTGVFKPLPQLPAILSHFWHFCWFLPSCCLINPRRQNPLSPSSAT